LAYFLDCWRLGGEGEEIPGGGEKKKEEEEKTSHHVLGPRRKKRDRGKEKGGDEL